MDEGTLAGSWDEWQAEAARQRKHRQLEQLREWGQGAHGFAGYQPDNESLILDPVPHPDTSEIDHALRELDFDAERLLSTASEEEAPKIRKALDDKRDELRQARDAALEQRLSQSLEQTLDRGHGWSR